MHDAPTGNMPPGLLWLLDAPLFIDGLQVEAMYDAILRPDYENVSETLSKSREVTGGADINFGAALPWFGKAGIGANLTGTRSSGETVTRAQVSNAYRHLLLLALHYHLNLPDRIAFVDLEANPTPEFFENQTEILRSPRTLVLIDLPPGTIFIPVALEVEGKVTTLYNELGTGFKRSADDAPPASQGESADDRSEGYWLWFAERFEPLKALQVIEEAVSGHSTSWIDYRIPLPPDDRQTLHIHLAGRAQFDTGVFAYQTIMRGRQHGLRVVGTLKSGPAINVLATFER